jgi:hypothetical protein
MLSAVRVVAGENMTTVQTLGQQPNGTCDAHHSES